MSRKHAVLRVTFSLAVAAVGATAAIYCWTHPPVVGFGVLVGLVLLAWGVKLLFDRDYLGIGTIERPLGAMGGSSELYGPTVNPATGLALQPGGAVDVGGNAYGTRKE